MTTTGKGARSRRRRASSACCSRAWARSPRRSSPASRPSRRGLAKPIGSLTQMGTIRLGKRTEDRSPLIKDFVPLAGARDLEFGGWDIFPDNAYEAARKAGVLEARAPRAAQGLPRRHQAVAGGVRPAVREEARTGRTSRRASRSATWPSRSRPTSPASRRRRGSTGWSWSGAARPRSTARRARSTRRSRSSRRGSTRATPTSCPR